MEAHLDVLLSTLDLRHFPRTYSILIIYDSIRLITQTRRASSH